MQRTKAERLRALNRELDHAKRALEAADFEVNRLRREVERIEDQIEVVRHPPLRRTTHLFSYLNTAACGVVLTSKSELRYDRRGWRG